MTYIEPPRILILDATQPLAQAVSTYLLLTILGRQRPVTALWVWQVPQRGRVVVVGSRN